MSKTISSFPILIFATLAAFGPYYAYGQFDELIRLVPDNSNSIFLIDAEKIAATDIAKQRDFEKRYADLRSQMPLAMPPDAKRFILASEINVERFSPKSETAIVELKAPRSIDTVVQATGGRLDTIGGKQCCAMGDAYVVQFSDTMLGAVWPADRQVVSRWLRQVENNQTGHLSIYLQQAAEIMKPAGTHAILAVDMQDAIAPEVFRNALQRSKAMQGTDYDEDAAVSTLSGLIGVTFGIMLTNEVNGSLRVDFSGSVAPIKDHANALLLEALGGTGMMLDEFSSWETVVGEKELFHNGVLSEAGVRKILSLISLDTSAVTIHHADDSASDESSGNDRLDRMIEAKKKRYSKQYYESIERICNDLSNGYTGQSFEQNLMWVQNFARQIDRMPTKNVDPRLVESGKNIAQLLDEIVVNVQAGHERAIERQRNYIPEAEIETTAIPTNRVTTPYGRYYSYAPMYRATYNTKSIEEYRGIVDEEKSKAESIAQSLSSQIGAELANMKQVVDEITK